MSKKNSGWGLFQFRQSAVMHAPGGNGWELIMALKQSEIQAVSEGLRELYANTDAQTLPHCIVRLLHRLVPANSAVYNSFDFRTGEMQVVHDHGPEGDKYLTALNEHIQDHPLLIYMRTHWRKGAASMSQAISQRELRDLPIYCEFLRPLGIKRQLGLLVEDREYGVAAVGLQRDGSDFSQRDKEIITLLQPHLIQACKNASDISRVMQQQQHSERALKLAQIGVVRLDPKLRMEWVSNHAANLLAVYFPTEQERIAAGTLPVKLEAWVQEERQLRGQQINRVAPANWQTTSARGVLSIRWVNGLNGGSDLVLSEQRSDVGPVDLESLGLTRREAEVLHWITQGKTNEVIGVILSTSKRTVDKQVESIFRKLGVESRVGAALRAERHRQMR